MSGQRRDEAGRFATGECPSTYRRIVEAFAPRVEQRPGGGYAVDAPRCPHGHFERWASRNCAPCRRG